jgi:hypothetical protein
MGFFGRGFSIIVNEQGVCIRVFKNKLDWGGVLNILSLTDLPTDPSILYKITK